MNEINLRIRKDGDYYWITSNEVPGLVLGGNDLQKVLSDAPKAIDYLVKANGLEPLKDYKG